MPYVLNPFTGSFDYYRSSSGSVGTLHSELPSTGSVDGSNAVFTFGHNVQELTLNGASQDPNSDVTVSGSTGTFITPPATGSVILNWYVS